MISIALRKPECDVLPCWCANAPDWQTSILHKTRALFLGIGAYSVRTPLLYVA